MNAHADRLWFSHGRDLVQAAKLLRGADELSERDTVRICRTMERIGKPVGLSGPWRMVEQHGKVLLAYVAFFDERMPARENYFEYEILGDQFTGGTIDGLPEPRYLGRVVRELGRNTSTVRGARWDSR